MPDRPQHRAILLPQKQTKVINEGCATFVHYEIMNRLHDKGLISDGSMLEFLHSHTSVVFQPDYDDPRYSGINPYALGFAMMDDIKRICLNPTEEDRVFFPQFAGNKDPYGTLRDAWANYRDESFILQFLSPNVIRKLRLFRVFDDAAEPNMMSTPSMTRSAIARSGQRWRGPMTFRGVSRIFRSPMSTWPATGRWC